MSTLADIASLEASAAIGVDHKAANFFNKQSTSEETRTLGTLLIDGNTTQEIKDNWIKALFQDGSMEMVTAIQLTQIDSLFNSDFLSAINTQLGPTVPDITGDRMNEMKRQVTQALLGYCKNAVYAGTSEPIGCHDPSKDIPIPQPGPATLDWYMSGLHANCPVGATCERFNSTQEELVGSLDAKPYLHSTAYISKIELVLGDYAQYLVWAGIRATISDTIEGGTYAQPAVGVAPTKENKVVVVNIEASNPITEIEMSLGARVDSIFIVHFKDGTSQDYSVYPSAGPGGSGGKRMRSAENPTLGGKRIQFAFPPGEPLVGFSGFSCIDTSETLTNLFPIKRLSS
uniref:Uncharacterized protein n=1 Tax=Mucochytrium quahogii TaxID=96639 RepID=A0A7S2WGG7_9STRA